MSKKTITFATHNTPSTQGAFRLLGSRLLIPVLVNYGTPGCLLLPCPTKLHVILDAEHTRLPNPSWYNDFLDSTEPLPKPYLNGLNPRVNLGPQKGPPPTEHQFCLPFSPRTPLACLNTGRDLHQYHLICSLTYYSAIFPARWRKKR